MIVNIYCIHKDICYRCDRCFLALDIQESGGALSRQQQHMHHNSNRTRSYKTKLDEEFEKCTKYVGNVAVKTLNCIIYFISQILYIYERLYASCMYTDQ